MKPENIEKIHESFAQQAAEFEKPGRIFSKKEYLDYIVASVNPDKEDVMLEAAAGTCAVSRAFAPYVKTVVSMDGTPVMLETAENRLTRNATEILFSRRALSKTSPSSTGSLISSFPVSPSIISRIRMQLSMKWHAS